MRRRWTRWAARAAIGAACAALLAAGTLADDAQPASGDAPAEAPKREPITHIGGSPPDETLQQRMERFKREKGAGSDKPFDGFATQAAAEMQRQRDAAIANGAGTISDEAQAETAVETRIGARERAQDALAQLGAWGASGCVEIEPAWSAQDDFIRHRKLGVDDFLSSRDLSTAAVSVSKAPPLGFAAIVFSCEIGADVQQTGDGQYLARVARVRYYAVMSRKRSWLAPHEPSHDAFLLGHQQLHFDMAEAFSRWLNAHRDEMSARVQGVGTSPQLAVGMLQLKWAQHMLAVHEDFDAIETSFDRDTKHGRETAKQTEWAFRLGDGFDALTKGMKLLTRPKAR
jgi:hypothetical protein